ncbi:MAG: copper-binding protein [Sphingomonas sp.]|uniref:copper-binding protein n=1 Tax=Sphingomonas sp. TaxID=28214 RepID=UPI0025EF42A5|nr:copper-binding protein [Sphingomonas sp.]MBY0285242.1 copper-binding protein [Sphingomonas sp.]
MKTVAILAAALLVTACGNPAPTPKTTANDSLAALALAEPKSATGEGSITAIDADTGKITLAHGPVAELSWPAMTMGFAAKSGQTGGLKVGDKVRFAFRWDGRTAEIESIDKI